MLLPRQVGPAASQSVWQIAITMRIVTYLTTGENVSVQYYPSIRTRTDAESRRQVLVTRSRKSLGHDVHHHQGSLAILELYLTTLDLITDVMVLDVEMLSAAMIDRIL